MQGYPGTGYWHWYFMPVPIRKFYINKHLKRLEKDAGVNTDPKPLSSFEKIKMNKDIQKSVNDPSKFSNVLQAQRNKK